MRYAFGVRGAAFDEAELFRAIARSGARALLIGRRALVALGLPVLTADYDLWLHGDDVETLNRALGALDLEPNRSPEAARKAGRYVLENDEHVDVLVARRISTKEGAPVHFEDVWSRREELFFEPGIAIAVPTIDDLILTKRVAMRDKDVADIRLLEALKRAREGER